MPKDVVRRIKALGERLGSRPEAPVEENRELERTRKELQKARRELIRRNRELAKLRTRLDEGKPGSGPASAAAFANPQGPAPFFIVGPPKSGTSWLQATLNSHPEILCSGEGKFFGRNLKTDNPYGQWGAEVSAAMSGLGYQTADRASLYSALADSKDLRSWFRRNGGWSKNENAEDHIRDLVRLVMDYVFAGARARSGKSIVGDKTPSHIQYLEEIREFYPEARIIHIIRDGRDQAVSSVFHWWRQAKDRGGFFPLSAENTERRDAYYENNEDFGPKGRSIFDEAALRTLAEHWRDVVGGAVENGPRLFDGRYFEVRYEDLLARPEPLFKEMVEFLDAEADSELVEKIVRKNSFESKTGNRALGMEDPESFLRKGIAGDWKNHFTDRDKRIYKKEAGDLLVRLGYEKDNDW